MRARARAARPLSGCLAPALFASDHRHALDRAAPVRTGFLRGCAPEYVNIRMALSEVLKPIVHQWWRYPSTIVQQMARARPLRRLHLRRCGAAFKDLAAVLCFVADRPLSVALRAAHAKSLCCMHDLLPLPRLAAAPSMLALCHVRGPVERLIPDLFLLAGTAGGVARGRRGNRRGPGGRARPPGH